jgi:hypothetical protein
MSGDVEAVVAVAVDLAWVNRLLARTPVPPAAAIVLADRGGAIRGRHPDPGRWVGTVVRERTLQEKIQSRPGGCAATGRRSTSSSRPVRSAPETAACAGWSRSTAT